MRSRIAAASSERTIALTGPTAAGVIEKFSAPRPISAMASSGRPGHFAANADRHVGGARGVEDALEETQDRRAQPVVALREPRVGAVGGEQELGQVVGADREEIDPRQQLVEHFGEARHLEHGAE